MTPQIALLIAEALVKYGPEYALIIANLFKTGATLDQAIAALEAAVAKRAEDYLVAARAAAAARAASASGPAVPGN